MKSRKGIILLICLAVVVVIIAVVAILLFNSNKVERLLKDENVQVELLASMYKDMLKFNDDANIVLDESALKNILTNEKFSEENTSKLKEFEKDMESSRTLILKVTYAKKTHTLYLSLTDTRNNIKVESSQYKIDVSNGKLVYKSGIGHTVFIN